MLCGINETLNPLGPHKCDASSQCNGARYCSQWGWCEGMSGCGPNNSTPTGHADFGVINTDGTVNYHGKANLNVHEFDGGVTSSINIKL